GHGNAQPEDVLLGQADHGHGLGGAGLDHGAGVGEALGDDAVKGSGDAGIGQHGFQPALVGLGFRLLGLGAGQGRARGLDLRGGGFVLGVGVVHLLLRDQAGLGLEHLIEPGVGEVGGVLGGLGLGLEILRAGDVLGILGDGGGGL